ncbi:DUF4019 domain-containing protein [Variovorax sp. J22G21]|uniref:DUF4019 domain-containing protein n=1 Tax=Variovorax fucosicus TaxID=3053517 RepID=UPI0025789278|nr:MULTISPECIES: DUF4019 domain-containing protein [unclassified Variovorax]MDM0039578.1 DUF4019 domain-containing protein [Variovorax sp. J22R193]MDM0054810.1 DUF4019 domain-containing protein [Variovorax sp. J22G47]MDM0064353.1 DUF4019 domain-containing protein [Variovorax sp. J22G21]
MKRTTIKLLFGLTLLAGWLGSATAQDVEASDMVRGGLQVIQLVDQAKTGELWDGAAPAARKRVARADFMAQISKLRGPLGAPLQRTWVAINRQVVADSDADLAGQYVSVEYETRFTNTAANRASMRELVSFHMDRDGIWRFSGYVLR